MNRHVLEAIVGIALLSFMDAAIKALVEHLPVIEIACLRYAVGSLAMTAIVCLARPGWPRPDTIRANAARAIVVVITAVTFFYALGVLPLAETLVLSFVSPIFTAAFAGIVLGERLDRRIGIAIAAGLGGVLIIVLGNAARGGEGTLAATSLLGVAAVLVSAVAYSASNVLLRARAQRDPLLVIVLIQNVVPGLILCVPTAFVWTAPSPDLWLAIGGVGMLGASGALLLARAYAGAEATRLAPLDYTALIWAALIGFAAFGEVPSVWVALGAVPILIATALASRR